MSQDRGLGIAQLDRLLAPFPERAAVLLVNDPGVDGQPFLHQAAHHWRTVERRPVVYVAAAQAPRGVRAAMRSLGFDPCEPGGELAFVDAHTPLLGLEDDCAYRLDRPDDADAFSEVLAQAARDHAGAALVVDGLSTLVDHAGADRFRERWQDVFSALRRFGPSVSLFTRWPYPPALPEAVASRFDGVVSLRAVEGHVTVNQYFAVERAPWAEPVTRRPLLYRVLRPGGVLAYVPKLLVTGPYNAGKSTFVHNLSDDAVSVDRLGTTVALDHGHVTLDGLTADLFGTPGQQRFDPLLDTLAAQALGVILVVDSTKPETFPRARELLEKTWRKGTPAIVAANKQDLPTALAPDEVAARLGIGAWQDVRVVGCTGTDREGARRVLRGLLEQLLHAEAPS